MQELQLQPAFHKYGLVCTGTIILLMAVGLIVNFLYPDFGMAVLAVAAFLSLLVLFKLLNRFYLHITTSYIVTESEITQIAGLWVKNETHVPIDRIEDYAINRSFLGKILGVASIGLQTARAEAGYEMVLQAIPETDVATLDALLEKLVRPAKK